MTRSLTPEERSKIKEEILKESPINDISSEKQIELLDNPNNMVIDVLQHIAEAKREAPFIGEVMFGAPGEMQTILDFTGLRGSGSNIYHKFIYLAPKWRCTVKKVGESLFVSPVWAEYYNLTIAQKQKIESAIKTGLASATQAVADFELLKHDSRRYREIIDYFVKADKTGDEHVLRSLFVDRVDAYTGEGFSMVTMARRWPTIITDFIRMKSEWTDPKIIKEDKQVEHVRKELDVSAAEATVLKTKNRLYREWVELFLPQVKERYARIENLVKAREKSVDEYRQWLKPYIAKFKTMKETEETRPGAWMSNAYVTPGFGQTEALVGTRLWVWKSFPIVEMGKPAAKLEVSRGGVRWEFDPYDDWVKRWQKRLEYKYNLKFEEKDVNDILTAATSKTELQMEVQPMYPEDLYYILFDMHWILSLLKTPPPEGIETDNLMIFPLKTWVMSQNALLLHLMEIRAREDSISHYINEIIGAKEIEQEILERVEEEFRPKKPDRFKSWRNLKKRAGSFRAWAKPGLLKFYHIFFRPGPYEPVFFERVSKMYFRASGQYYGQVVDYLKDAMRIGKTA
jgi:hypothetical protein